VTAPHSRTSNWRCVEYSYDNLPTELAQGVVELCRGVFGENEANMCADLFEKSPRRHLHRCFIALTQQKGEVVGCVHLLDVPFRYGDISLHTAELGIVATHPAFRNQGISQELTRNFQQRVREEHFELVELEGIPHFYLRYGFHYAIPMRSTTATVPELARDTQSSLQLRPVQPQDVGWIQQLHHAQFHSIGGGRYFTPEILHAKLFSFQAPDISLEGICTDSAYLLYQVKEDTLHVFDISDGVSFAVFQQLLRGVLEKEGTFQKVEAHVPAKYRFCRFLEGLGGKTEGSYAWQVWIPDLFAFFQKIKPMLQTRLQQSWLANESFSFHWNTYHERIRFDIRQGKIEVARLPFEVSWECNVPGPAAARILFGDFSTHDLQPFFPDLIVKKHVAQVLDVLFPKRTFSFFGGY